MERNKINLIFLFLNMYVSTSPHVKTCIYLTLLLCFFCSQLFYQINLVRTEKCLEKYKTKKRAISSHSLYFLSGICTVCFLKQVLGWSNAILVFFTLTDDLNMIITCCNKLSVGSCPVIFTLRKPFNAQTFFISQPENNNARKEHFT